MKEWKWDSSGQFWYDGEGNNLSPGDIMRMMIELLEALKAVGGEAHGYCFCPKYPNNPPSGQHTGECKDAQIAIYKVEGDEVLWSPHDHQLS